MRLDEFLDATFALLSERSEADMLKEILAELEKPSQRPLVPQPGERQVLRPSVAKQNQAAYQQLGMMMSGVGGKKPMMGGRR